VFPKNRGKHPKIDGEYNGKPYLLMDDLGGKPTIFGNIHIDVQVEVFYQCLKKSCQKFIANCQNFEV